MLAFLKSLISGRMGGNFLHPVLQLDVAAAGKAH